MKIAVLSGKGGTGKTLVSVNLAAVADQAIYLDCDVEEPNGYLYFKPENVLTEDVTVEIPSVNDELCTGCRECVDFCAFNALAYARDKLIVFNKICHSCGGCILFCPSGALSPLDKVIGTIETGHSDNVKVVTGKLKVGEVTGVPIINKMQERYDKKENFIITDSPPGSACVVMDSIKDADYCILVAEPTVFGLHNLKMVLELVALFNKPFGIILNKCQDGDNPTREYCEVNKLPVLTIIPYDEKLGYIHSIGSIAVKEDLKYQKIFSDLLETIEMEASL